ncbi:MAG TPA: GNAT family N-acetyltransferase [Myxococcaceae bacterium]|nr:GNAT family N-acetyltransferase [Myxococcaceae bacterium]
MLATIETERLRLRPLTPDDFPFFAALNADPVVSRYLATGKPRSEAETRAWFDKTLAWYGEDGTGHRGVVLKEGNRLVGRCGLQCMEVELDAARPRAFFGRGAVPPGVRTESILELGYGLVPDAWGKGIASEASRRMRDEGFARGEAKLMSVIRAENVASIRVAEKNGLSLAGELEFTGRVFLRYEITREAWRG